MGAPSVDADSPNEQRPWQVRLFDNIWLLAVAAITFFTLSYAIWGLYDIWVQVGG